jgi:hypothetical protein
MVNCNNYNNNEDKCKKNKKSIKKEKNKFLYFL